jgi:multiple sugar transport system substrate-binding protein
LALPAKISRNSLHNLATWVWGMGGDFLNADGTRMEFTNQSSLDGFKAYFALWPYMGKQRTDEYESDSIFLTGKAAVTISVYWVLSLPQTPEVAKNLGIAPLPSTSFVGGEHFAIWKHSRKPESALKLARFISRKTSGELRYPEFGLPVTPDGWDNPRLAKAGYDVFLQALQHGRPFSASGLWGLVEKRLADTLPDIWNEVMAHPERKDSIVENQLMALAQRLRMTLRA